MTWLDSGHPTAALLGLVLGAVAGWWCPALIARIPEPEPEDQEVQLEPAADVAPEPVVLPEEPPKELYADIAALPGLAWKTAVGAGVVAAALAASVGWSWSLLFLLPLAPVGVALGLIDWRTRLLPKRVVLPAHVAVMVLAGVAAVADRDADAYLRALIAMLVLRSIFWVLWWFRSSGMGFGDVRLSALLGFVLGHLGWQEVVVGTYAAFLLFVVPGVAVAVVRRDRAFLKTRIPFGPFMLLGAVVGVVFGPALLRSLGY